MRIRQTRADDISALQTVVSLTGLFPEEMLPDMLASSTAEGAVWLSCEVDGSVVGFCFAQPEQMAEGVWNMLALAVHPDTHRAGHGRALVSALEDAVQAAGARLLLAETSGTDDFSDTRKFYSSSGYKLEATIKDFWALGDAKIVFTKSLIAC